jgi:histidinol-phosphate aminotransferase
VRHWDKPRISEYLRISVGTDADCERLLDVLRQLTGA